MQDRLDTIKLLKKELEVALSNYQYHIRKMYAEEDWNTAFNKSKHSSISCEQARKEYTIAARRYYDYCAGASVDY